MMNDMMMNAKITFFDNAREDCTNRGLTSCLFGCDTINVVDDEHEINESNMCDTLVIVRDTCCGKARTYARPSMMFERAFHANDVGPMSGGNCITLPDGEVVRVFDRYESKEMYHVMSI